MGLEGGERDFIVAAPPSACFDAVLDFESYPEWQRAHVECDVLERDSAGRGLIVESIIDAKLRRIRYVLEYTYEEPREVRWTFVEGDPRDVVGAFVFEEGPDGGTLGVYRQQIDAGPLGRLARGPIKKGLLRLLLDDAVTDLRKRVEGA